MKKKVKIITGIMIFSLFSIFFLQTFWLYNYYQFSKEQFNRDIVSVLKQNSIATIVRDAKKIGLEKGITNLDFMELTEKLNKILNITSYTGNNETNKDKIGMTIVLSKTDEKEKNGIRKNKEIPNNIKQTRIIIKQDSLYSSVDLKTLVQPLRKGLDSLFKEKGISAKYAVKLYNSRKNGDFYIDDKNRFNLLKEKQSEVRIGFIKPYYMQLAIEPDYFFFVRNMQNILIASIAIIVIVCCSFVYMLRTIFQQKKLAEMKTDFINNMTHEFKTPITTVALGIEAMKNFDVMNKPELAAEYLNICESEIKRVAEMVEKVLRLSAFERSEIILNPQQVNLVSVIEDAIKNMQFLSKNSKAKLSFTPAEQNIYLKADRMHLSGVIYNLIDNSLKYAGKSPSIEISCRREGNSILIEFSDDGIGIPRQYQHRIFEKFFRVPIRNLSKISGFGLGLNYVSTIINMHHGSIILNNRKSSGTHFTITLSQL